MGSGSTDTPNQIVRRVLIGLLLAGVIAAYSNSLGVPFLLDDFATIPGNPTVVSLSPITSVLFPPPTVYSAGRPMLNLSYAVNYAIGRTAVGGYHVVNLAIHLAATAVLFGLLRRTLELPKFKEQLANLAAPLAFVIAGMWALHPMNTVSVTYISQRAESMMGLFYLLTVYCFVRSAEGGGLHWKIAAIVACGLGMATKEVMVTAPVLVFLFDATCVGGSFRKAWVERWRHHLGMASMWLVLGALMVSSEVGRRAVGVEHGLTWFNYARLECFAVARYLWLAMWPSSLVFDYGANLPLPAWRDLVIPAVVLFSIGGLAIWQLYRCHVSGFLGVAFFLLLAPTSSVVPVAGQPIAENRMYLPLAVLVSALAGGACVAGWRRSLPPLVAAIAGFGYLCHHRNHDYRSDESIWQDTVAKQPVNERAWVYLSEALKSAGRTSEAIEALFAGLRRRPESAELENNIAVALFSAGRAAESMSHFQAAIRLKPQYAAAYYNFGVALYRTGNVAPALECFQMHLKLNPHSVETHNFAGLCYLRLGRPAAAIPHFQRATEIDPGHRDARTNLELATAQLK